MPNSTILQLDNWILKEVMPVSNSSSPDAGLCYWLVFPADKTMPLVAQRGTLAEHGLWEKIFRLSRAPRRTAAKADDTARSVSCAPAIHFEPHESPSVGTKLLWQDEVVKIWEFRLNPDERCPFHRHVHPYFFLNLTASTNQELNRHGDPVPNSLPSQQIAGQCTHMTRERLSAHAVRNVGDTLFLQFIVEFQE